MSQTIEHNSASVASHTSTATTLRELEIGDIFIHKNDKAKGKFIVRGNSLFNIRHGSATRLCVSLRTKNTVSKSSRLAVIKIGESKHKQRMIEMYGAKKSNKEKTGNTNNTHSSEVIE